jgi:heat-inducible transcriptional repressor
MATHPELSERDRRILDVLVQRYIDGGEPISSLWLASRGFGVSSATVRNILARLEEQGYVRQPHTSAGRVPTDLGLSVLRGSTAVRAAVPRPAPQVEARLRRAATVDDLVDARHAGSSARLSAAELRRRPAATATLEHLDFVPLDGGRVLVVIVSTGGHVTHKVIEPSESYTLPELEQAANYLNGEFRGSRW